MNKLTRCHNISERPFANCHEASESLPFLHHIYTTRVHLSSTATLCSVFFICVFEQAFHASAALSNSEMEAGECGPPSVLTASLSHVCVSCEQRIERGPFSGAMLQVILARLGA